ncbi:MAG TPA: hypothetical protein VIL74_17570 [Pyrinomonadaceae bacterium]|jgi:MFS family permease
MNQSVFRQNYTAAHLPLQFCFKCRWEGRTEIPACPRCGRGLFSQTNVRWRGVALVFLGLFLSGLMSGVAIFVTLMLAAAAEDPRNRVNLNGAEHLLILGYLIFAGFIGIGVTMIAAGLWQIIFGRRNMVLIWVFFALIFITFFIGSVFRGLAE